MVNFLFLGEIVGRGGINALKTSLSDVKEKYDIDYTIANGEGATGGYGLGVQHAMHLSKLGINLITGGEKLFYKKDLVEFLPKAPFIIRPNNYPSEAPGRSIKTVEIKGRKFIIISLEGTGLSAQCINNPFQSIEFGLGKLSEKNEGALFLLSFHSSLTAEKRSMLFLLNGRVSAVIGTHTKVLTADEYVTEKGTGYITDTGRVGSGMSVGGFNPAEEIKKLRTGLPLRSVECSDNLLIQGVAVSVDENDGKCKSMTRINWEVPA